MVDHRPAPLPIAVGCPTACVLLQCSCRVHIAWDDGCAEPVVDARLVGVGCSITRATQTEVGTSKLGGQEDLMGLPLSSLLSALTPPAGLVARLASAHTHIAGGGGGRAACFWFSTLISSFHIMSHVTF